MNTSGPEPDGFGPEVSTTQSMKNHPKTICSVFGTVLFYLASFSVNAQYLENFTGQNGKGLVDAACTGADISTCTPMADLTGVNWTLSGDFSGFDASSPDDFGVINEALTVSDSDNEVCWNSPTLYISSAGEVSLSLDLSLNGTDIESDDYIDAEYKVNNGDFATITTAFSSGGHSVVGDLPDAGDFGMTTVTATGITGDSLNIRVCFNDNGSSEQLSLDNVSVPETGVTLTPPVSSVKERQGYHLSVFPNPAQDQIAFESPAESGKFRLFNATGRLVRSGEFQGFRHTFSVNSLPGGLYSLVIYATNGHTGTTSVTLSN